MAAAVREGLEESEQVGRVRAARECEGLGLFFAPIQGGLFLLAMAGINWCRQEVEAIVDDYLSMLASELVGTPFNKTAHRRALKAQLSGG